ncbi:uncharacterized protein LOC127862240 [Dreissena polymorpha]|uniref:Uncharacterized protein n=1 Tax=Dreissena polymorpha TaxID=45954 RepID=A0A9D4BJB7_DREPO|nr:uncharacterized protein LOC127862240 [Dreissena polymorpha]KAH3697027.1 hypothetical protein DPMN_084512 [Dreissena polymorpha]
MSSLDAFMQSKRFWMISRFPCFVTMDPDSPLRGVYYFPEKQAHEIQFVRIEVKQDSSIGAIDQEKRAYFVGKEFLIPLKYGGFIRQMRKTFFGIDTILGNPPERIVLEDDSSLLNSNETVPKNVRKGTSLGCFGVLEGSAKRKLSLMDRNGDVYIVKENTPLHYSAFVDLIPKAKIEDFLRVHKALPRDIKFDDVSLSDVASSEPEDYEKLRIILRGMIQIKSIEKHEFYIGWLRTSGKNFTVSLIPRNVAANWDVTNYRRADERERSEYTHASYEGVYGTKLFTKDLGITKIIVLIPGENTSANNIYIEAITPLQPNKHEGGVPGAEQGDGRSTDELPEEPEYARAGIESELNEYMTPISLTRGSDSLEDTQLECVQQTSTKVYQYEIDYYGNNTGESVEYDDPIGLQKKRSDTNVRGVEDDVEYGDTASVAGHRFLQQ